MIEDFGKRRCSPTTCQEVLHLGIFKFLLEVARESLAPSLPRASRQTPAPVVAPPVPAPVAPVPVAAALASRRIELPARRPGMKKCAGRTPPPSGIVAVRADGTTVATYATVVEAVAAAEAPESGISMILDYGAHKDHRAAWRRPVATALTVEAVEAFKTRAAHKGWKAGEAGARAAAAGARAAGEVRRVREEAGRREAQRLASAKAAARAKAAGEAEKIAAMKSVAAAMRDDDAETTSELVGALSAMLAAQEAADREAAGVTGAATEVARRIRQDGVEAEATPLEAAGLADEVKALVAAQ